jgi:hypothetical protein
MIDIWQLSLRSTGDFCLVSTILAAEAFSERESFFEHPAGVAAINFSAILPFGGRNRRLKRAGRF